MHRPDAPGTNDATGGGRLAGVRRRLGGLFSPKLFVLALALSLVGLLVGGAIPIIGVVGRFVGVALAGFALGLVADRRRYVEVGLAGAVAAGLGFVASALGTVLIPYVVDYGVEIAGVGATAGLVSALVGHYFGRDLRAGLRRDL
ncbi:MAG: hypothetical protein ABEJ82_05000 [Haloplanus sp.]